jgi:hypothetical protein
MLASVFGGRWCVGVASFGVWGFGLFGLHDSWVFQPGKWVGCLPPCFGRGRVVNPGLRFGSFLFVPFFSGLVVFFAAVEACDVFDVCGFS